MGLCSSESDVYGQAASNLVAGTNFEATIQQILDMGGGSWDRDTVVRALRAAFNNPERAVEYLYSVSFFQTLASLFLLVHHLAGSSLSAGNDFFSSSYTCLSTHLTIGLWQFQYTNFRIGQFAIQLLTALLVCNGSEIDVDLEYLVS